MSFTLGIVCVTSSVIDLHDPSSSMKAMKALPKQVSKCKRDSYAAFYLCLDGLAKTKKERSQCVSLYITTFPNCYFKKVRNGRSALGDILQSYSNCVMESINYGETFACDNAKNEKLAKSASLSKLRGDYANDMIFEKRDIQRCNECRNNFDVCAAVAVTWEGHDLCVHVRKACFELQSC